MKRVIILTSILIMLLTGCQQGESPDGANSSQVERPEVEEPRVEEPGSGEFNVTVTPINEVPNYFTPSNWLGDKKLFGISGSRLIIWNRENKQQRILAEDVWTGTISPTGKDVAYVNEQSLYVLDVEGGISISPVDLETKEKSIPVAHPMPYSWSPGGSKLIYAYDYEWSSEFYIYDSQTGTSKPYQFKNQDNFLSYPVGWINNKQLLFLVSSSEPKTGKQEYTESGYRNNLMIGDMAGNLQALTDNQDFNFVLSPYIGDGDNIAYILYNKNNDSKELHLLNPATGVDKVITNKSNLHTAVITANGQYILYHVKSNSADGSGQIYAVDLVSGKQKLVLEVTGSYSDLKMLSHNTKNQVIVTIKDSNDSKYEMKLINLSE
ncbi:MAG: hypothetical protein FH758_11570 [Firmicutes bacterium]|nr:hypothetical protein [Bacillota bacterium]